MNSNLWYLVLAIVLGAVGMFLFLLDPNTGELVNINTTVVYTCTKRKPIICKDENGVKGEILFIPKHQP